MMDTKMEQDKRYTYEDLLGIVDRLRGEGGCPWDRAQTHESLIKCLREECEEVVQAIENRDDENLCEELGDVMLQVLMHSHIAQEENRFHHRGRGGHAGPQAGAAAPSCVRRQESIDT